MFMKQFIKRFGRLIDDAFKIVIEPCIEWKICFNRINLLFKIWLKASSFRYKFSFGKNQVLKNVVNVLNVVDFTNTLR